MAPCRAYDPGVADVAIALEFQTLYIYIYIRHVLLQQNRSRRKNQQISRNEISPSAGSSLRSFMRLEKSWRSLVLPWKDSRSVIISTMFKHVKFKTMHHCEDPQIVRSGSESRRMLLCIQIVRILRELMWPKLWHIHRLPVTYQHFNVHCPTGQ